MVAASGRVLLCAGMVGAAACSRTALRLPDGGSPPIDIDAALAVPDGSAPDAATDAAMPVPVCIPVPADGEPVKASFTIPVSLVEVDVMLLLDSTGSMADEIDNVRTRLRTRVVPGVRSAIADAEFGVALLGEFPAAPYGPPSVKPYELRLPVTRDTSQVEAALDALPSWGNYDDPEAQVEALYQVATGQGLDPWISPSLGCPAGGVGGACFRQDALPVILLITDAPFHNGPPSVPPFAPYVLTPEPHSYDDAVAALRRIGALVVGLGATDVGSPSPMPHLQAIARDTGAVTAAGPLAIDIGNTGTGLGDSVVEAVEQLAAGVPLDVSADVEDVPGDAYDARQRVVAVRPAAADPMSGVQQVTADGFVGVTPGTRVTFEVEVTAAGIGPITGTVRIPAQVVFRAFGRSRIGTQPIEIVIGPGGCG